MSNKQISDSMEYLCYIMEDLSKLNNYEHQISSNDKEPLKEIFERILLLNKNDNFLVVRLLDSFSNFLITSVKYFLNDISKNEDILVTIVMLLEESLFNNITDDSYRENAFFNNLECYFLILNKLNYSNDNKSLLKDIFSYPNLFPKQNEVMSMIIDFYLYSNGKEIFNDYASYILESVDINNHLDFFFKDHLVKIMNFHKNFPGIYDKTQIFAQLVKKLTDIYNKTDFNVLVQTIFDTEVERNNFKSSFMKIGLFEQQKLRQSKGINNSN